MKPNELLEIIKERRSYRQFEEQQIKKEELDMILEAGQYAPNAGGRQSALFLVTQDKEINETLGKINRQAAIIISGRYVNKAQPSIIDNPKITSGFYGAPTIITLLAPKNFIYSEADCVAAGENMLLMASSLGLGGCMIARGKETMSSEYGQALLRKVGIDDNYQGFYHIILGYPKGKTFVKERNVFIMEKTFKEISIDKLNINPMNMFGKDWCLASAGNKENGYNGMTIAWGHLGAIWNRKVNGKKTIIPTVCVYLRPQRYTKQFFEKEEYFTICTFDSKYKKALGYMGSHSGKDENKIENAGLTPLFIDHTIAYLEAKMIFVCKKIYQTPLLEKNFINKSIIDENYPKKDFHEMYIGEILKVYVDND